MAKHLSISLLDIKAYCIEDYYSILDNMIKTSKEIEKASKNYQ